jgi:arylsulfatase A-like enzyme
MDALNARHMQVHGYDRPTTPFILEWAKDAIVFQKAYASSNWTTPATMSIMTSQRPWTHRTWYQAINHPVNNYEENLPKIMKEHGYAVYGFVQNYRAHPKTLGIKNAFLIKDKASTFYVTEVWWSYWLIQLLDYKPIIAQWIVKHPIFTLLAFLEYFEADTNKTISPAELVYNRFLKHISQASKQPFFAWMHLMPPHDPYLPPEPYMGIFGDADKFNTRRKQNTSFNFYTKYDLEMQENVDILGKRYDEFVLYSDQKFKLFLSKLAETIDMSDTIIILSSDHGESFSHGFLAHNGPFLYEDMVHIPLIMKLPQQAIGRKVDTPVEHVDIAPTILELAGIAVPGWMEGKSLLSLLQGESLKPRPIFSMWLDENRAIGNHPINKGSFAVWDGDYKLIHYLNSKDKETLLYNLRSDPDETENIFREKTKIAQKLMKLINDNLYRANTRIIHSSEK